MATSMREQLRRPALGTTGVILGILGALELVTRGGLIDGFQVVPSSVMFMEAYKHLSDGEFWSEGLVPTFSAALISFVLASIIGVVLGFVLFYWKAGRIILEPYLIIYYAVPIFALYPILIALFGLGPLPVITLATLFGLVVITVQTLTGLDSTRPVYLKVSREYQLNEAQHIRYILAPAAMPSIYAGLKLGLSYCIVATIAVEFILSANGIGRLISLSYNAFLIPELYGAIVVVMLITVSTNVGLDLLERLLPHRRNRSVS